MVIEEIEPADTETRAGAVEVHLHGLAWDRHGPEHVIRVDMRVVIVNLLREVGRSDWTGVQVKSNERERASAVATIVPDEHSLVKSHVSLKRQVAGLARFRVEPSSAASKTGNGNEPIEVGDVRGFVDVSERTAGRWGQMVNEDPEGREWPEPNGNRLGLPASSTMLVFGLIARPEHARAK